MAVSYGLLVSLRPLLARHALAKPNIRSSHATPTPQGGGIAVVAATLIVAGVATLFLPPGTVEPFRLAMVFAAATGLAIVGFIDDLRPLDATSRLVLQAVAVAVVIYAIPAETRIVPVIPWW